MPAENRHSGQKFDVPEFDVPVWARSVAVNDALKCQGLRALRRRISFGETDRLLFQGRLTREPVLIRRNLFPLATLNLCDASSVERQAMSHSLLSQMR